MNCADGENDAASAVREALERHRTGDLAAAIQLLERALETEPGHPDALETLGVLYAKQGQLDRAIDVMERLRDAQPDLVMAWTNLSRFYRERGDKGRAEEAQAQARLLGWREELSAESDPSLAPLVNDPGSDVQARTSGPDPAVLERRIAQYESLLEQNPNDRLTRFTLARTLLQADRVERATETLEALVEDVPEYSAAYSSLAEAYARLGRLARCLRTLEQGIAVARERGDAKAEREMREALATRTTPPSS